MRALALALLATPALVATPAAAQDPMSFAEFEAYVTNGSYTWARPGQTPYGIETYHPDRRVLWTILGEDCKEGFYYPGPDNQVCFEYPASNTSQCWLFFNQTDGLRGVTRMGTPVDLHATDQDAPCIEEFLGS